jgi:phage replication O-like protein O
MVSSGAEIQPDKNWTKVHNGILEVLASTNFTARELRCLLFLLRMTYGYQCKESPISLTEWEQGTKLKRGHVSATLKELVARNIIAKEETGTRSKPVWAFNKYFEQWQASTPLGTTFCGPPLGTTFCGPPLGTTDSTGLGTTPSTPLGTLGSTPVQCATTPIKEKKELGEERGKETAVNGTGYFGMPIPQRREKTNADYFTQQATKAGVNAPTFVAIVNVLIEAARWRVLIDDLGETDKLNYAKENAVKLILLGNTTPEHVSLLVDMYRKAHDWRRDAPITPKQLMEYAGQVKDGLPLPTTTNYANGNGRAAGTSKVDRSLAAVEEVRQMLREQGV